MESPQIVIRWKTMVSAGEGFDFYNSYFQLSNGLPFARTKRSDHQHSDRYAKPDSLTHFFTNTNHNRRNHLNLALLG